MKCQLKVLGILLLFLLHSSFTVGSSNRIHSKFLKKLGPLLLLSHYISFGSSQNTFSEFKGVKQSKRKYLRARSKKSEVTCEHDGIYNSTTDSCQCYPGYEGEFCEDDGDCNPQTRQRPMKVQFEFDPPADSQNIYALESTVRWVSVDDLFAYGDREVSDYYEFETASHSGYFGDMISGHDGGRHIFIFSVRDGKDQEVKPLHGNCHRNFDKEIGPKDGVECTVSKVIEEGDQFKLTLKQVSNQTEYTNTNNTISIGAEWAVTAKHIETGEEILIGSLLFPDPNKGV